MNNYRAGLYGFASTTAWLHETGVASPPLLVMLGLTLPDSRILSGVAGIGLTLANIAAILPHLRQPVPDNLRIPESALIHEQSTLEPTPDICNVARPVHLLEETPVLAPVSACKKQHQTTTLTCSTTIGSMCLADTEPLGCPNVEFEVAARTEPLSPAGKSYDGSDPCRPSPSRDADFTERNIGFSHLFARESRGALYIPLPVPDAEEDTFFNTEDDTSSPSDIGEEWLVAAYEQYAVLEEHPAVGDCGPISGKGIEQDDRLVGPGILLPSTRGRSEVGVDSTDVTMPVTAKKETPVLVPEHHSPSVECINSVTDVHPAREGTVQNVQADHSFVAGKPGKHRPECLEFIPQSVIRRYPSALMIPAGHCFGRRAVSLSHNHQVPSASAHVFIHNPEMLLDGIQPRASHTTLPEHLDTSFLTEVQRTGKSIGAQIFVTRTVPAKGSLEQELAPLPEPPTAHEPTPLRRNPPRRRRPGVLARAALRDRRPAAQRHGDDGDNGSSTSDSGSAFDSDSQYSSGSSVYEGMLPHMLGADLIAAIDANSEPELNFARCRKTKRTPLNVYEDFLISDDSVADVSMIMRVSANDDASDGETENRAIFRSLTHEEIQRWASGVVQKCVRRVCRKRVPAEPLSPSQASDVCAERPSGSGVSQCPLSGLHCKVAAAEMTDVPAQKTKVEPPGSLGLPATSTLPSRKPLQVRNLRDIPEFVPRQRHVPMVTRRVEGPSRHGTRSTIAVTRDAATQVIARMESQAGFNVRQWLVGTGEKRMANMAGGRRGALGRCA